MNPEQAIVLRAMLSKTSADRYVLVSRKGFTAEARGAYADTKHVSLVDLADGGMTRKGLGLSPPPGITPA